MLSRFPFLGVVRHAVAIALLSLFASAVWAAPVIRVVGDDNGNFGQVGQWVMIEGEGFDGTLTDVLFSKSGGGTVAATDKMVSRGRGMILVAVPVTAVTGTVVVRVDGVSSPAYPFTVNAGTFSPGANTVSGLVRASGLGVQDVGVLVLTPANCDEGMEFWYAAVTDSSGFYSVKWPGSGDFFLFLFPPLAAGLAGTSAPVMGTGNLINQNFDLTAGTTVTGRVLNASSAAVPNAAVSFEGDAYENVLTDGTGNFSLHLSPGFWQMNIAAPINYHAMPVSGENLTVPVSSPYALGDRTLASTVWVSGILQDDLAAPVVSARVSVSPPSGGNWINETTSGIGGAFGLEVPLNTALQLGVDTARTGPVVDSQSAIGPYSVDTNLGTITLPRAGYITGRVTDESSTPLAGVSMQANHATSGSYLDGAATCNDGTFILKVPSVGTTVPVRASVSFWNDSRPYANQTYNNKNFQCEGDILNVTGTGTVSGINFTLHPGGSISGTVTQYFGGSPISNIIVAADDGGSHSCYFGGWPSTNGGGGYQTDHLPIVPLRVWAFNAGPTYSRGSYTNKIFPQYTAVTPVAGAVTPNINIALQIPQSPKAVPDGTGGTQAAKLTKLNADGSLVQGTWDVTTCPPPTNHDYNLLVGVGSTLSSYGLVGSLCGVGRSGTFTGAAPAVPPTEKFLWFILVQSGGNGSTESSWGKNSLNQERIPGSASNQCQYTIKDTSGQCP